MSIKLMSAVISSTSPVDNYLEDSGALLRQLLECVQSCQRRFGGKTELATEFDACVAGLCINLEAIFTHGLRVKPIDSQQVSALKQVSDIVANSLHLGNENPAFWPFVSKHLTKHEKERYIILRHIWTDIGRGRAWIRSTLNERSLERYFHIVLSNQDLLFSHYEPWALLCDQEKSSMLPNMAAGLNSILFAVSIDKPELNIGSTFEKIHKLKKSAEPIIEAPIPKTNRDRTKNRRKKKVAKQFISFDDDESNLSSSVPSSSSSITSDNSSLPENSYLRSVKLSKKQNIRTMDSTESTDDSSSVNMDVKRKPDLKEIPIEEKFGNRFSTILEGTLTPISQVSVGELTPISVETRIDAESPDNTSDDIVEVPTDISAVLTAVEKQNKEEINKLNEKISGLNRENDQLKGQLKKYVSAVQMLKHGEGNDDCLDDDEQPDYKNEAKLYEQKLVQVAEMHAEIMNFNARLQHTLSQKETLLNRLKTELEEIRGPMSSDEIASDDSRCVNVWIPSAFLTGTGSDAHHVYQIYLRAGSDEWNIYRRYAQFYALHKDLKKLDSVVSTFNFPPKKSIGNKDSALVEERRKRLQIYLRKVLLHWPELSHCDSRYLLEQHLSFFRDQREDDQRNKNKKGIFSARRSQPSDNHYSGL